MNCPYCNKLVNGLTGLIELEKFRKHLISCKKNPKRIVVNDDRPYSNGKKINLTTCSMIEALNIRAKSGQ